MERKVFLFWCATLICCFVASAKTGNRVKSPATRFTCQGRASGYYADVETGCQVYHMCDGLGRQFSYSCPNTTLFQQRMLICDHWYMVNCSNSESDYDANLLIGQRDKPFVSDEEMRLRTPRPDILSVPPNDKYYDGLREAESKFPIHPDNSIVGISDSILSSNDLDGDKPSYRPPTSWSMSTKKKPRPVNIDTGTSNSNYFNNVRLNFNEGINDNKKISSQNSGQFPSTTNNRPRGNINPPSQDLSPPLLPPTTTERNDDFELDVRVKTTPDPVFNFIKRFDPNSPDSIKTTMTKTEIIDLNQHLPDGQVSSEEDRTPRKNKNFGNNFNVLQADKKKSSNEGSRFNSINVKSSSEANIEPSNDQVPKPSRELLPPKTDITELASTTMGPPIYYEWKWAVPAFDLEPPKLSNETNTTTPKPVKPGKRPFSVITRSTPKVVDPTPSNTEYNISSYFVPDYVFPLDGPHPGYDDEDAHTSFQVQVSRPGRASYGENPACPHCHPAYLNPGTCEPCIVKR
ncbi:uncharacterized protein LOC124543576 [Vanessa cardui]|uniref:uncharacterized protein LOC124543576 n=1 Tax=Vanessa cardui TaxID=171605 RepID=UPI001F12D219|nr:uncharacterized protein LOC124543576 [Vanessa cardui]XP_046977772.1 uncharacterized protein LOC124543576 [Vanessa cardui]XP_046977773.1 uncharacterized protein LOC124543576 [Vanessa cardui]XP_046977774.1 uncharacterized protein LOC124543576 [Vanessa cardui]XP_046977775.1 uncharacterized protein LOC124543576 [Vanessa cardui]